jgi:hypothetical protein
MNTSNPLADDRTRALVAAALRVAAGETPPRGGLPRSALIQIAEKIEGPAIKDAEKDHLASDPRTEALWDAVFQAVKATGLPLEENGAAEQALYDACLVTVYMTDIPTVITVAQHH